MLRRPPISAILRTCTAHGERDACTSCVPFQRPHTFMRSISAALASGGVPSGAGRRGTKGSTCTSCACAFWSHTWHRATLSLSPHGCRHVGVGSSNLNCTSVDSSQIICTLRDVLSGGPAVCAPQQRIVHAPVLRMKEGHEQTRAELQRRIGMASESCNFLMGAQGVWGRGDL